MADDQLLNDDRFAVVAKDPKFKRGSKHRHKVKIDERFRSMFENDAFKVRYHVDKRGRKITGTSSENLKKFYSLPSDDEDEKQKESSDDEDKKQNESSDDEQEFPSLTREEDDMLRKQHVTPSIRKKLKDMSVDYARGEGVLCSESSSDESDTDEDSDEETLFHEWNELDKDADSTEKATNRLAVCNMDWDRIKAVDLMILFNSFLPPKAIIQSVVIYPSEFGLKRMAEEEALGPAELISTESQRVSVSDDEDFDDTEAGQRAHMERIRQYQMNRLKYYYAIATFDTPITADYIYTNCNGLEYESSGIRLDLRFVDDETTFDQEPKDVCDDLQSCRKYNPTYFTNTALQQAKVDLTWDETDPRRLEFTQKIAEAVKTNDIDDSDLENYVALSSSEDDDSDDAQAEEIVDNEAVDEADTSSESEDDENEIDSISKFRNMLKEIEENEKDEKGEANKSDTELEITWGLDGGAESTAKKTIISKKSTKEDEEDKTPFEQLLQRRKEIKRMKRKMKSGQKQEREIDSANAEDDDEKRKEELKLLLDDDDNKHHFSLKKIERNEKKSRRQLKKRKQKDAVVDDFQVNVNDNRFEALYSSHLFNIDPTNPKFTKTKGMSAFVTEKQRRIASKQASTEQNDDEHQPKKKKVDAELHSLVKSVKNKTNYLIKERSKRKSASR